jgi:predicted RNA polymerase sigma factor
MLLTDARRPARTGPDGSLIPLAEQDRRLWDAGAIAEGTGLIERALAETPVGPYQLQAAIAAIHDAARSAETTDWRQIAALYEWLERLAPGPMVTLNRIAALAMFDGPEAGLARLAEVESDAGLRGHRRTITVRAHLLEMAGDPGAADAYRDAARRTLNLPERRYLEARVARLERGRGRP